MPCFSDLFNLPCVVRHVPILKPQSVWSDLFIFQSLTDIKFHSSEGTCRWHLFKTLIWDNFGGQFTNKLRNSAKKKNTPAMCINSILSIEATFSEHHISIKETGRLEWHLIDCSLKSHTRKPIKFKINFWKSEAFLTDPTNIARK